MIAIKIMLEIELSSNCPKECEINIYKVLYQVFLNFQKFI